ncbi:MAG: hypothetical protein JRD02_01280 [Deltaproteobacteria bacterium]|nr:hypothetical protein [Deltaproteobacteria bacterium]
MYDKLFGKSRQLFLLGITAFFLLNGGCYHKKVPATGEQRAIPGINKVVVVGFLPAMQQGDKADVVRDPISGSVFMAEPVPQGIAQRMTDVLFSRLVDDQRFGLVSPGQARGVFSKLVDSDRNVGMAPVRVAQAVGRSFRADAVLGGYIYRWREREGGDYAVKRPASVAFNLHLIRPSDGAILWKSKYDKTQRSLSEDLFDFSTFVEGGGRWMTAEKLAMIGLEKLLAQMPGAPVKEAEKSAEKTEEGDN